MPADHTSQASGAPGALSEATTDEPRRSLEGVNPGPCISAFLVFAGAVQAVLTSGALLRACVACVPKLLAFPVAQASRGRGRAKRMQCVARLPTATAPPI